MKRSAVIYMSYRLVAIGLVSDGRVIVIRFGWY
jgi:hypothetical protein